MDIESILNYSDSTKRQHGTTLYWFNQMRCCKYNMNGNDTYIKMSVALNTSSCCNHIIIHAVIIMEILMGIPPCRWFMSEGNLCYFQGCCWAYVKIQKTGKRISFCPRFYVYRDYCSMESAISTLIVPFCVAYTQNNSPTRDKSADLFCSSSALSIKLPNFAILWFPLSLSPLSLSSLSLSLYIYIYIYILLVPFLGVQKYGQFAQACAFWYSSNGQNFALRSFAFL